MAALDRLGGLASETTLAIKAPCLVATTGSNITLSGVQVIDGVTVGNNSERVLVKDQTDPKTNNIYVASTGNWTLAQDAGGNTDWVKGTQVFVVGGTVNVGLIFQQVTSAVPVIIGTTALIFQPVLFNVSQFIGSNTQPVNNPGAQVVVQNSSVTGANIAAGVDGNIHWFGVTSAVYLPQGGTIGDAGAFYGYVRNRMSNTDSGAFSNAVIYGGIITSEVANSSAWAANYLIVDTEDQTAHGNTGIKLIGIEFDFANYETGTAIEGIPFIMDSPVQAFNANGIHFSYISVGKWTNAIVIDDGCATTAMIVGALSKGPATSVNSQPFEFARFDSGGVEHGEFLYDRADGSLFWSGTGIAVSNSLATTTSLSLTAAASQLCVAIFSHGVTTEWELGSKQNGHFFAFDVVGNTPIWDMPTGGTFAFTPAVSVPELIIGAGTTAAPQISLTVGVAPTSPSDGALWYESGALKFRLGGSTKSFTLA